MIPCYTTMPWGEKRYIETLEQLDAAVCEQFNFETELARRIYEEILMKLIFRSTNNDNTPQSA